MRGTLTAIESLNLHNFAKIELPHGLVQIMDPTLLPIEFQSLKLTCLFNGSIERKNEYKGCHQGTPSDKKAFLGVMICRNRSRIIPNTATAT